MVRPLLVLTALLLGASVPAMAQDARSIVAAMYARFDEVWNTRDAQNLAALYASDGILVPPVAPAGTGPEAVVTFFKPLFANNWSGHKLEPISASQVAENTIVAASHWSANLTDASGKTTRYHGDVGQVFTKVGDQWKIKLASWNVLPDK